MNTHRLNHDVASQSIKDKMHHAEEQAMLRVNAATKLQAAERGRRVRMGVRILVERFDVETYSDFSAK